MAQLAKSLLCKRSSLRWIPKALVKKKIQVWWHILVIQSPGRQTQVDPRDSLSSQPSLLSQASDLYGQAYLKKEVDVL